MRDATNQSRESIGLSNLGAGSYVVELTSRAGAPQVHGTIDAKIVDRTIHTPFTTAGGARTAIGVITISREEHLTPVSGWSRPTFDRGF